MAEYQFLAADLVTGAVLAELPLQAVKFSKVLNQAGTFSAQLSLSDPRVKAIDPIGSTEPARTVVWVSRDGVLLYGAIIWSRDPDPLTGILTITGAGFLSYFSRRFISATTIFTATDQLTIARTLMSNAQAVSGGNIGIVVGTNITAASAVTRDRTYFNYEMSRVFDKIAELSALENGFDFAIDVYFNSGVPTAEFMCSYPRRGATTDVSGYMFELGDKGGNIITYKWPENGADMATTSYATGAGSADAMLIASAARTDLITGGYPLLEAVYAYQDVTDPSTLTEHATADVNASFQPVTVPQLTVDPSSDPVLGSYSEGDDVRVRIDDDRFDNMDVFKRIVQIDVTPPDATSPEQVVLTLGEVPE